MMVFKSKSIKILLIILALLPFGLIAQPVPGNKELPESRFRQSECLNGLWDFKCDSEKEWTQIRVPGSYSVLQDTKWGKWLWDSFLYPQSWTRKGATYKKQLHLPADLGGKVVKFYCGACCFHSYVAVNNIPIGESHDGFYPFEFTMNDALDRNSGENTLFVKVSEENELTNSGESKLNRGIQEDTYLNIYPEVFVDQHETVIKTHVKDKQIGVNIQVNNTTGANKKVFVRHFVTDTLNRVVKVIDAGWLDIPAKSSAKKEVVEKWQNPHCWTLYDPYLYRLQTVLYTEDGQPFDKNIQRFGFREISTDKHHLYLNGEELFLHGHGGHDLGDLQGTREYMKEWLLQMKARGINFMRMHIYPRHEVLYDVADEVGFLIEAEGAFHFKVSEDEKVWKMHLGNMVKYQRNHPSVILWSVSNELRWNGGGEKKPMIDYVRSLDSTRPVFASDFSLESRHGDVIGHHYNPETVFEEWAEYGPNKPMIWDELGSVWQEERPLYNGTAGYEASSQDWATGMWRDGLDQILKDIEGFIDGKKIGGELHRVNGFVPWDLSYVFMRWQPTNKARNLWLQHGDLSGPGLKQRVVQPCSSPVNIWDKTLPEYEPNPGFYIFEKHLRTVRFFDTDDYRSYFGGTKIVKTGKLYYEDLRTADALLCNVELPDGKVLSSNVKRMLVKSGDILGKVDCSFTLPEVDKITEALLVRRFYRGKEACSEDKLPVKIYPSVKKIAEGIPDGKIGVINSEKLLVFLKSNGRQAVSVERGVSISPNEFSLIIANSISDIPEAELTMYLKNGGKAVFLNDDQSGISTLLERKSMLTEDFKGSPVPDLVKSDGFVSRTTRLKWNAGGGLISASMNMLVDQIGMITFKKFDPKASSLFTRFDDCSTPFTVRNMARGQISFRFDNDIDKKSYTLAQCSRDIRILIRDKSQKWYISSKKNAIKLNRKEGDAVADLSDLSWQIAEFADGIIKPTERPSVPDLSEVYGAGIFIDPLDAQNYSFTISKFELRGQSLPAAKIPYNGGVHKITANFNQADLSFWRNGSGQKILELPNGKSNFRTIFLGNKDGDGAALFEEFSGKGIAVHSGLNIVAQIQTEPAAIAMLASILQYVDGYMPEKVVPKCGIIAENAVADLYLQKIGFTGDRLQEDKLADLSPYSILLIDGESLNIATRLNSTDNIAHLQSFVENGGRIMFTALNDRTIEVYRQVTGKDIRLTTPYLDERSNCVKAAISWTLRDTPKDPVEYYDKIMMPQPFERNYDLLISGLANKDLFWNGKNMFEKGIEVAGMDPVVASPRYNILISNWKIDWTRPTYGGEYINESKDLRRAYWFVNRDPVVFKLNEGNGFYLFNQLNFEGSNESAVRVIRQLLTNLGCSLGGENYLQQPVNSFSSDAQVLQSERFKKMNEISTPVARSIYGSPASLKPLIVSDFKESGANKPKVLVLGNAMMQNLAPRIKSRMGNDYEVTWNDGNLGNSSSMLSSIEPVLGKEKNWSIILIAIGEEDLKKSSGGTTVEQYAENVKKIIARLKQTNAKLYVITLPPVPQSLAGYNGTLPTVFNAAAKTIVDQNDVYTYDLNGYILRKFPDYLQAKSIDFSDEMNNDFGKQLGEALISFGAQVLQ